MRKITTITLFIFLLASVSLSANANRVYSEESSPKNFTDKNGMRQGYWALYGEFGEKNHTGFRPIVEEGEYLDNKRTGVWKKYYQTGALQSEINYVENYPYGPYTIYYPNEKVEEKGFWAGNKNTGEFTRYHQNGNQSQKFKFNSKGKRNGVQEYYFPDGTLQCSVEIENGVAHGEYVLYYPTGELRETKRITNGEVEPESIVTYKPQKPVKHSFDVPELPREETTPRHNDKPNMDAFKETGFNTLYNRNRQISQVGDFYEGRLWDGKWYKYDENGILQKVEVYRKGRFVGYGIIDDSNK